MGQVEVADQVEVLEWLANATGYLDMTKVAIHGWSYGGYLALMALVKFPHVFKVRNTEQSSTGTICTVARTSRLHYCCSQH
jgi:dienelactone hydrolase